MVCGELIIPYSVVDFSSYWVISFYHIHLTTKFFVFSIANIYLYDIIVTAEMFKK